MPEDKHIKRLWFIFLVVGILLSALQIYHITVQLKERKNGIPLQKV